MTEHFENINLEIRKIVFEWEDKLKDIPEGVLIARLNRQRRNIKHIVGHLIDSASNNHQRIVRLQYSNSLEFPNYTNENELWINIQHFQEADWDEMLQLWKYYNLHLAHVISNINKDCLQNLWSDGNMDPVSLEDIVYDYLAHLRLHIAEIKQLLD